jgi:hypothetical protein
MIKLFIIQSTDLEVKGEFCFFLNVVKVGSSSTNHLIFNDSDIASHHITLELNKKGPFIVSTEGNFFLLNGKKIEGIKKLNINDVVKVGSTSFGILDFSLEDEEKYYSHLNDSYSRLHEDFLETAPITQAAIREFAYCKKESKT